MFTRSGEWVIISGVKKYLHFKTLKSLRVHLVLIILLVGIIPTLIMQKVLIRNYESRAVEVRTAEVQNQCTILCNQIAEANFLKDPSGEVLQSELSQLANIYSGRIMVVNDEFAVVFDTYDLDRGRVIISESVSKASAGNSATFYDAETKYIEISSPIYDGNKNEVLGVMLTSVSTNAIAETMSILEGVTEVLIIIMTVAIALIAFLIGSKVVRPFRRITDSIEAVTEGFDDDYLHENAYEETEVLSVAFNKMLGRMKVLDDSRQEFVANVSHELKTPLTSMKVLADSLLAQEEVPPELYREFMQDLSEEIDRENIVINDLLTLVKLDKTNPHLTIEGQNINEMLERILKRLRPVAAERNIELVFESYGPVMAEVDEIKLVLAFSNLIENGIKYNHDNGWVKVTLDADHKWFTVIISDSGIGIPEEEGERIFERFYRVDKSRSGEISGTGLGLSIARSAVLLHRGAIKVQGNDDGGTDFNVRIPLTYIAI
ncbi:signal transduction histidine kinase [Lachnospiraceae bacterium PF1-21]|uniref:sensor histidine kinase n=1 Tax=Ohessyouella blattaphilus TaxID=2949333 RepID=UPI003E2CEF4B